MTSLLAGGVKSATLETALTHHEWGPNTVEIVEARGDPYEIWSETKP